ncbi:MAG: methylenetetrahydrofolate--tRNA-(uracil(54)-C(5))-methyltransferase (FADH(2)-oxidizing) TrmFO [Oscillospiraceae bacterium]|jgi:methylenetetrahydrofolate--tRNA-(uracil-5-)-methyltransferase|nr:methylenetetrahydrofolate--tRNA-(uracil(54)-C(5))-methyltransferase (FADH(2)-oxidizing) TrmFO [Oscillospiraceae bacterium]
MSGECITVIGAGLAGCEAAWQIAERGISVNLVEMKPNKKSAAHKSDMFAELVCSNSLKANRVNSAAGLLKQEMRNLSSLLLVVADLCSVPAGGALSVDRNKFSELVTERVSDHPLINIIHEEVSELPDDGIVVVATGPLTSDSLSEHIEKRYSSEHLSFYDAAAPIVTAESIDMSCAFFASRYGKGEQTDYINCPMNKEEYERFYSALISAERAKLHGVDLQPNVYEGCMPVEIMAMRGENTLRFGPMKPVGLVNPQTGHRPWANLQLRKESVAAELYNLVGFQTNLKFGEQKRVFGLIPALRNAEYARYGVMHRNTFINSPKLLSADFSVRSEPRIFFAGQITGVEGYMESAGSGILAGINAAMRYRGRESLVFERDTMLGALSAYISDSYTENFQPMGANFGILPPIEPKIRDKQERYAAVAERALRSQERTIQERSLIVSE